MRARALRRPPARGEPGVLDFILGSCRVLPGPKFPRPGILGFRCLAQDPCQTRRGFNPSLPPRRPRTFRRACAFVAAGRPSVELFLFFIDFYTLQKSLKNHIPQNTAKNLKSRTPDRPNVDFGITFAVHRFSILDVIF